MTIQTRVREITDRELIKSTIRKWHAGVEKRAPELLLSLFSRDVTLSTPFLKTPLEGPVELLMTMRTFIQSVESFHYLDTIYDDDKACLFFAGEIKGEHLQGVDVFRINESGQIDSIEVMARPLSAIQHLHDALTIVND